MRQPADWMTELDDQILEMLRSSGLVLSPSIIALNLDKSRESINRHLNDLSEYNLVEKVQRGKYSISTKGEKYLDGDLDVKTLSKNPLVQLNTNVTNDYSPDETVYYGRLMEENDTIMRKNGVSILEDKQPKISWGSWGGDTGIFELSKWLISEAVNEDAADKWAMRFSDDVIKKLEDEWQISDKEIQEIIDYYN